MTTCFVKTEKAKRKSPALPPSAHALSGRQASLVSNNRSREYGHGSRHQGQDSDRLRGLKGLGGVANALAQEGVNLFITARTKADIEATADEIRKATGVNVTAVAGDITTEEGRKQVLAACPNPDILINNAGGPPPGDFKDFSLDDWRKAVEWNMITPIALIKATVYGMMDRG